jgi:hypothetical protein
VLDKNPILLALPSLHFLRVSCDEQSCDALSCPARIVLTLTAVWKAVLFSPAVHALKARKFLTTKIMQRYVGERINQLVHSTSPNIHMGLAVRRQKLVALLVFFSDTLIFVMSLVEKVLSVAFETSVRDHPWLANICSLIPRALSMAQKPI